MNGKTVVCSSECGYECRHSGRAAERRSAISAAMNMGNENAANYTKPCENRRKSLIWPRGNIDTVA